LACQRPEENHPLLVAFPFHLPAAGKKVKVTKAQREEFRKAGAAVKGEAKQSGVPKVGETGKGLEGFGEMVFADRFGQGFVDFGGA